MSLLSAFVATVGAQYADEPAVSAAAAVKGVYFVSPSNGATVTSPFKVQFGVKGMSVKPAGELIEGSGHHHLLIGVDGTAKGQVVPADAQHLHFGKGQTETDLTLPPGTHRLTMQFADGYHASYGKDLSATITVTVK